MYQQKPVLRSVFRAYDIRGIVGQELDEDSYYSIALAIACRLQELGRQHIFLAQDARPSSPSLAAAMRQGFLESGINVVNLGTVSTPIMYYATCTQDIDCGVVITASHNPSEYNGIKIVLAGKTLVQEDMDNLYQLIEHKRRLKPKLLGKETHLDVVPSYRDRILSDIKIKRPLKVVVDCGNGMGGPFVPSLLSALGCTVIPLYCDLDGTFPNHHPDPSVMENLVDLKAAIATHNADLGLAFDGDADRLGLITDTGEVIYPDRLMILFLREVLSRVPGATIVYDVKSTKFLATEIEASGGVALMSPTGHSIVKGIMKQKHAALAGEMSGHIFFKDRWYGFDDALYSATRLLEIISASPLSVSEQFQSIPNSVNTPELKIAISEKEKSTFMETFKAKAQFPDARIITIDGIRVEYANGWGLLRASNTTSYLVARFEAENELGLKHIQEVFRMQILQIDKDLVLPF